MDDRKKTEHFVELYMLALKAATQNPWLRSPKEGSDKWNKLDEARRVVDEIRGEYGDYIRVQFSVLKRLRINPSPNHLCSEKAKARYQIHLKLKNKYTGPTYSVEGDYFMVTSTNKRYPIKQVDAPIQQDPDASYAQYIANEDKLFSSSTPNLQQAREAVEYAIAKLRYHNKVPTERMIRALNRLSRPIDEDRK